MTEKSPSQKFSAYDRLESLNMQVHSLLEGLRVLGESLPEQNDLISDMKSSILNLLAGCEEFLDGEEERRRLPSKHSQHLVRHNLSLDLSCVTNGMRTSQEELQFRELQERVSFLTKQVTHLQSKYFERIHELDNDLDEAIFALKEIHRPRCEVGNILPSLMNSTYDNIERDAFELNLESAESSGPPSGLMGSRLAIYEKLHRLHCKMYQFKHTPLDEELPQSEDEVLNVSLPISMKSITKSGSIQQDLKQSFDVNISPSLGNSLGLPGDKSQSVKLKQMQELLKQDSLSLDVKERLLMTLINPEGPPCKDACLDDLLGISKSSLSSFTKMDLNESGFITFKGKDKDCSGIVSNNESFFGNTLLQELTSQPQNEFSEQSTDSIFPPLDVCEVVPVPPPTQNPHRNFRARGRKLKPADNKHSFYSCESRLSRFKASNDNI